MTLRASMTSVLASILVFTGIASPALGQVTVYVNAVTGNDAWSGMCSTWDGGSCGPKRSIAQGIGAAVNGDTVLVADGVYTGFVNHSLPFAGKAIVVRSENGPETCFIDAENAPVSVFIFQNNEGPGSVLQGFRMINAQRALFINGASPTIRNCIISNCINPSGPGVVYCDTSDSTYENCVWFGNSSNQGGAIHCRDISHIKLVNCTLIENDGSSGGGGVYSTGNSTVHLTNCIVRGNTTTGLGPQLHMSSSTLTAAYNNIEGGQASIYADTLSTVNWDASNIDVSPGLALANDFHPMPGSLVIDVGTNAPIGGLPGTDADGVSRPLDGNGDSILTADMGAYEFNAQGPCIALSATRFQFYAAVNDIAPPDKFLGIRNSGGVPLNWTIVSSEAWIQPTPASGVSTGDVQQISLHISHAGLSPGDYQAFLTVSDPAAVNSPRTVHVRLRVGSLRLVPSQFSTIQSAVNSATSGDTVLIADGTYTGIGNKDVDFLGKTLRVRSAGGPNRCVIDCQSEGRGFVLQGGLPADALVEGFTISNGFTTEGSAFLVIGSQPTIARCVMVNNRSNGAGGSGGAGGAIRCHSGAKPTFVNCAIVNNQTVSSHGGALGCLGSGTRPTLLNCTLANNSAGVGGGAVFAGTSAALTITNCILWGNTAPSGTQGFLASGASATVTFSDVQDGQSAFQVPAGTTLNWGTGNINANPLFAFPSDVRILPSSPCVEAGDNSAWAEPMAEDPDGNSRPLDGNGDNVAVVDLGAHELNPFVPVIAVSTRSLAFAGFSGMSPAAQAVSIRNACGGTLNWQVTESSNWLSVSPASGQSNGEPDEVQVSIDVTGLSVGDYTTQLLIEDPAAVDSPISVEVTLHVGGVRNVPAQYATIQAAINAAVNGDLVNIAAGTYVGSGNKNLQLQGKAITIRGSAGASQCKIDCQNNGRAFEIVQGEGPQSIIEELTLTNGSSNDGGAIQCTNTSPTIKNCVFFKNSSSNAGGGLWCQGGSVTALSCVFDRNTAVGRGGGAYASACSLTLEKCTFRRNSGSGGGAVRVQSGGNSMIRSSWFHENTAADGGAINWSLGSSSSLTVRECFLRANSATNHGGGLFGEGGVISVFNCVIASNEAFARGGAAYLRGSSNPPRLLNCSLSGNTAARGGALHIVSTSPAITNTMVWGNEAPEGPELSLELDGAGTPCSPTVTHSNIRGGQPGVFIGSGCTLNWGAGNLAAFPRFAFPDDLHLMPSVSCSLLPTSIDAGNNTPAGGLPATDLDGVARIIDGDLNGQPTVDLGAYEFVPGQPTIAVSPPYVNSVVPVGQSNVEPLTLRIRNTGGVPLNWNVTSDVSWLSVVNSNGTSSGEIDDITVALDTPALSAGEYQGSLVVNDAVASNNPRVVPVRLTVATTRRVPQDYPTIQAAINAAGNQDIVLVADGTYTGAGNRDIDYLGKQITVRSENGPEVCTVDCQGGGRGFYFHLSETKGSVLSGFTIKSGSASQGGGIAIYNGASPTIEQCIVMSCAGPDGGGGIACADSAPTIRECSIFGNTANEGGGLWLSGNCKASILNCVIRGNNASRAAGVLCVAGGSSVCRPSIRNCFVFGNTAADNGGGLSCLNAAGPLVLDTVISGNAASFGGGLYEEYSCQFGNPNCVRPQLTRCWITANSATFDGGGAYGGATRFTGCRIVGNSAGRDGGGMVLFTSQLQLRSCELSGNTAFRYGGAIYFEGYGGVSNCTITGNLAGTMGGGCYFLQGGPALANSIVRNNQSPLGSQVTAKLSGAQTGTLTVNYTDLEGGQNGIYLVGNYLINWGVGNFDVDAGFVAGTTGTWTAAATFDGGSGQTTFVDAAAAFTPNLLVGKTLTPNAGSGIRGIIAGNSATTIVVWGNLATLGSVGASYEILDPHIQPNSPCLNAGNPAYVAAFDETDIDGDDRVIDIAIDVGADEIVSVAPTVPGDLNGDGQLNGLDIQELVQILLSGGPNCSADLDGDGDVDFDDLGLFIGILLEP